MSKHFIRLYEHLDFSSIQDHTLIYGALAGMCSKCKAMDLKLETQKCPKCNTEFHYASFQSVRENMPKMNKLKAQRPSMKFVDYDDFKKLEGEIRARNILG